MVHAQWVYFAEFWITTRPSLHTRPSHVLHTFWMGKLRLVMHMQVNPGKQHTSVHAKAAREGIGVDAVQSFVKREECLIELSLLGNPPTDGYCPLEAVISLPAKLAVQGGDGQGPQIPKRPESLVDGRIKLLGCLSAA
jgi:hypothetical protein